MSCARWHRALHPPPPPPPQPLPLPFFPSPPDPVVQLVRCRCCWLHYQLHTVLTMTVQLQQVVTGVVGRRGRGTGKATCLNIRRVGGRGIGIVSMETVFVGVEHTRDRTAELAGEVEMEGKASLPVQSLTSVDMCVLACLCRLLVPCQQSSQQNVEFEAEMMDAVLHALFPPTVQLVTQEHSASREVWSAPPPPSPSLAYCAGNCTLPG